MGEFAEGLSPHQDTRMTEASIKGEISGPDLLTPEEIATKPCLIIPKEYLWGMQPRKEYRTPDVKKVKSLLKANGMDSLQHYPPVVVAMSYGDGLQLVVLDGHHRIRLTGAAQQESPNQSEFGDPNAIPCAILTPEEALEVVNRRRVSQQKTGRDVSLIKNMDEFKIWIQSSISETSMSFTRPTKLPDGAKYNMSHYHAEPITGVKDIAGLREMFPSFTPNIPLQPKTVTPQTLPTSTHLH